MFEKKWDFYPNFTNIFKDVSDGTIEAYCNSCDCNYELRNTGKNWEFFFKLQFRKFVKNISTITK